MNQVIHELTDLLKNRPSHFLVISGNVYDVIKFGTQTFDSIEEFLILLTKFRFPNCILYDLFLGVQIARGDANKIKKAMGIKEEKPQGKDAELVAALKQLKKEGGNSEFPINPLEAFPLFHTLLTNTKDQPTAIVIDYADALTPAGPQGLNRQQERALSIALTKWSRSQAVRDNNHIIILICRKASDIEESLLDRSFQTTQVRIPKPDEEERTNFFLEQKVAQATASILAKASAGLSLRELGSVKKCLEENTDLDSALPQVFALKQRILGDEYGDLLEIMQARHGFEAVGGLEKPIAKLKKVAQAMREGKTSLVPQGILFMGPPGTGKTILAEALAKEAGLNFIRPKDIKSMWVGESERRMTKFLNAVKDLAPVAIFIDEFDQNQGQRDGFDGDSGVSKALFKKMLEVMSDTSLRGKILWILATNRPDLIDPAMKRPGRCDLRIPFLAPDDNQLALICDAAFKQYPDMKAMVGDWRPYAKRCSGYTGADMVEVIRRAWEHANESSRESIDREDMEFACEDYRPQIINKEMVLRMSLLALTECSSKNLLPNNWEGLAEKYQKELKALKEKAAA